MIPLAHQNRSADEPDPSIHVSVKEVARITKPGKILFEFKAAGAAYQLALNVLCKG
jgi:hypothetical protein